MCIARASGFSPIDSFLSPFPSFLSFLLRKRGTPETDWEVGVRRYFSPSARYGLPLFLGAWGGGFKRRIFLHKHFEFQQASFQS